MYRFSMPFGNSPHGALRNIKTVMLLELPCSFLKGLLRAKISDSTLEKKGVATTGYLCRFTKRAPCPTRCPFEDLLHHSYFS